MIRGKIIVGEETLLIGTYRCEENFWIFLRSFYQFHYQLIDKTLIIILLDK